MKCQDSVKTVITTTTREIFYDIYLLPITTNQKRTTPLYNHHPAVAGQQYASLTARE